MDRGLTAGEGAHGEGEVLTERNADAVLHYVIALEAMLTGGDSDRTELMRKVVQRSAVLAGADNDDRIRVRALVADAYKARSAYAHGSEALSVDLPALRRVVRKCLLARLIIGDPPPTAAAPLADVADTALLDHRVLQDRIRRPVDDFWMDVNLTDSE